VTRYLLEPYRGKMKLKALILNCTLKKSPAISNTRALINKAVALFTEKDVATEVIRVVDHYIPFGVSSKESENDEWPLVLEKVKASDILVIGSPIWFGVRSSVAQLVFERLEGSYSETDPNTGQFPMYGKVAGVIITGNEDGAHNVAAHTLFNLSHLGFTIPPNVDTYWLGPAGPGPSYIEAGGAKHLYTNKTVRFMVDNLVSMAQVLKRNPIPTNLKQLIIDAKNESR
jgi:multimeric flavodoxin WrbA